MPATAWDRFLFGLCFGMGFAVAEGLAHLIGALLSNARL